MIISGRAGVGAADSVSEEGLSGREVSVNA
jgi:hypothetical protein